MLKKWISLMMAAILFLSVPVQAMAEERNGSRLLPCVESYVEHEDGSISDRKNRAYRKPGEAENITLVVGQHYRSEPFIAYDSRILAFNGGTSIVTPDGSPSPVIAWVNRGGSSGGYANAGSGAWLEIKAVQPGTATVKVSMNYPRSADGEALYPYGSSNAELAASRTYNVTVQSGYLRMDLKLNSNTAILGLSSEYEAFWNQLAKRIIVEVGSEALKAVFSSMGAAKLAPYFKSVLGKFFSSLLSSAGVTALFNTIESMILGTPANIGSDIAIGAAIDQAIDQVTAKSLEHIDNQIEFWDTQSSTFHQHYRNVMQTKLVEFGTGDVKETHRIITADKVMTEKAIALSRDVMREQHRKQGYEALKTVVPHIAAITNFGINVAFDIAGIYNDYKSIKPIGVKPEPVRVTLELQNIGPAGSTIDVGTVELTTANGKLFFNTSRKMDKLSYGVHTTLVAGDAPYTKTISIYPQIAYHKNTKGESGSCNKMLPTTELAYEDMIHASCQYTYQYGGVKTVENATAQSANLPVYTNLYKSDIWRFKAWVNQDKQFRTCYIMCPVNVEVLNEKDEVLFTAVTDSDEVYAENGIVIAAMGDAKYVSFQPDAPEGYKVRIIAVEDGTMSILAGEEAEDGTRAYGAHDQIPLSKGDTFLMTPETFRSGSLHKLADDGTQTAIEPTLVINEENVKESLSNTDISDWAVNSVTQATLRSIPIPMLESFQQEITTEDFANMLLDRYEEHTFNPAGSITEDLEASDSLTPATDLAKAMDLLPALEIPPVEPEEDEDSGKKNKKNKKDDEEEETPEPVYLEWNADAPITRGQAAIAMSYALQQMGLYPIRPYQTAYPSYDWTDVVRQPGELSIILVRAINSLYGLGVMRARSEEPLAFEPDAPLTMEEAIAAINELDTLCRRMERRNDDVMALLDTFLQTCTPNHANEKTLLFTPTNWDYDASMMPFGMRGAADFDQSLTPDLSESISNPLSTLHAVASGMRDEIASDLITFMADNIFALYPEDDKDAPILDHIQLYEAGHGELFPWDGGEYAWIPFSFKDEEGGVLNDEIYLYVCYTLPYLSEDTANLFPSEMTTEAGQFILTDQKMVRAFLEKQSDLITGYDGSVWVRIYGGMEPGMEHKAVGVMQQELKDRGFYSKKVNNTYDSSTEKAVKSFQKKNGLEQTGVASQFMMDMLFVIPRDLERGDEGADVRRVRQALIDLGYLTGKKVKADDEYDKAAVSAMEAFQEANGLEATGIADAQSQLLLRRLTDNNRQLVEWLETAPPADEAPATTPSFLHSLQNGLSMGQSEEADEAPAGEPENADEAPANSFLQSLQNGLSMGQSKDD